MNYKLLYTAFFILVFLSSCHDDLEISTSVDEEIPSPEIITETTGSILGYVYDENNQPIADALVKTYAETTQTDAFGVFQLNDTNLDGNGTFIGISKEGYINGSDMIYPKTGINHSYTQLLSLSATGSFNSSEGGIINVEGGGSIQFSPNSIIDDNGMPYEGEVIVTAKRIGPEGADFIDKMPGALIAEDKDGYTRSLGTLGMLATELRSPDGRQLNLQVGTTAECRFLLSNELIQTAPETIPIWSFDDTKKLWLEEGIASLSGNEYIAQVPHFSFWNCDAPFPLVHVCGQVLYDTGMPAENIQLIVEAEGLGSGTGYSDSEGNFCGKMPKDIPLSIKIYNPFCTDELQLIDIAPLSQNTQLDDIILNTQSVNLTGLVTCLDEPISNGYLVVSANEGNLIYPLLADGSYNINLASQLCDNVESIAIFAVDAESGEASLPYEINLDNNENLELNIEVCADCEFELMIQEGDINLCNEVILSVTVEGGSGNYTILWDTGEETNQIFSFGGLICVTVTDNLTDCQQNICREIPERDRFDLELDIQHASCGTNSGQAVAIPLNGMEPYSFNWSDNSGTILSTTNSVSDLPPGAYFIELIDGNDCVASTSFEIVDMGDISMNLEFEVVCPETFVYPFGLGGTPPYTFSSDDGQSGDVFVFIDPGEYCITTTDNNDCQITECFFIESAEPPYWGVSQSCNGFQYEFLFNDASDFLYGIEVSNDVVQDSLFNFVDGQSWEYNILDLGFSFEANIYNVNNTCSSYELITLPNYDGLEVIANPASCETCTDGWIEANLAADGVCFQCTEDSIEIYAAGDLTEELTTLNQEMMLPTGAYYVVVKDITGCVVAFELINL